MKPEPSQRLLACLTIACCLGYYLILALRPSWLAGRLAGLPASILLALSLLLLFCLIAARHGRSSDGDTP
ncbi:hypothetical protein [Chromobacterium sphagni]|uniref:DUF485 domain-containing protein n=1 Tax=Chromobacterium sphagni TaxID=1903179 RepID=A0A1S1X002_9NEIS|nr:hypothetical protein [Chromobacterium sphagni]OHX12749.1 hypothetical protein BI347_03960 [Chromobacterium sphagni]OHX21108.1 hypothetical protein BI344_00750 [Chromobacterium sphagni]